MLGFTPGDVLAPGGALTLAGFGGKKVTTGLFPGFPTGCKVDVEVVDWVVTRVCLGGTAGIGVVGTGVCPTPVVLDLAIGI